MKAQKNLLFVLGLLLTGMTASASGGEKSENSSSLSLERQLSEKMTCPAYVHYRQVPVKITLQFHVNNDFSVVVEDVDCNDEILKQHVLRELQKQKLLIDREKVGKSFTVRMTYM